MKRPYDIFEEQESRSERRDCWIITALLALCAAAVGVALWLSF